VSCKKKKKIGGLARIVMEKNEFKQTTRDFGMKRVFKRWKGMASMGARKRGGLLRDVDV